VTDAPLYREAEGLWHPAPETKGPFPGQHAGAVAGLLAGCMERWAAENWNQDGDAGIGVQLALYLLRPVPVEPLTVEVEAVQTGRRVAVLRSTLTCKGKTAATAEMAFVRGLEVPSLGELPEEPRAPEAAPPFDLWRYAESPWYADACELRQEAGDAHTIWIRPRRPVLPDAGPMARVAALADWISGLTRPDSPLDPKVAGFPNVDLTVHLARAPQGEWIGFEGTPLWHAGGHGLTATVARDARGVIGRAAQSVVLLPLG
jgi:acyl-coenzyme A thioesterase PaaI-like protein